MAHTALKASHWRSVDEARQRDSGPLVVSFEFGIVKHKMVRVDNVWCLAVINGVHDCTDEQGFSIDARELLPVALKLGQKMTSCRGREGNEIRVFHVAVDVLVRRGVVVHMACEPRHIMRRITCDANPAKQLHRVWI